MSRRRAMDPLIREFQALTRWQRWAPVCRVALLASALLAQLVAFTAAEPELPSARGIAPGDPNLGPDPSGVKRVAVGMLVDGQTYWALEPRIERRDDGWLLRDHLGVEQLELELDDPNLAAQLGAWARRICWDVSRPLYLIGFEGAEQLDEIATTVHAGCPRLEVSAVEFREFGFCGIGGSRNYSGLRGWRDYPPKESMCEL